MVPSGSGLGGIWHPGLRVAFMKFMWEVASVKSIICRACGSLVCAAPYLGGVCGSRGLVTHCLPPTAWAAPRGPLWGCLWGEAGRVCALCGCVGGSGKSCVLGCILCALRVGARARARERRPGSALSCRRKRNVWKPVLVGLYSRDDFFPPCDSNTKL